MYVLLEYIAELYCIKTVDILVYHVSCYSHWLDIQNGHSGTLHLLCSLSQQS